MNCKTKNKNTEEFFAHLPEPSRGIAVRAWKHREKCREIEQKYGEVEAKKYHELHRWDGTYRTEEQKEDVIN